MNPHLSIVLRNRSNFVQAISGIFLICASENIPKDALLVEQFFRSKGNSSNFGTIEFLSFCAKTFYSFFVVSFSCINIQY